MGTRVLFLFLDGVGLGAASPDINPFAAAETPFLNALLGGVLTAQLATINRSELLFRPLDARLDQSGLPQSATGQTSLLTGLNGAELMGRHYGPWPGPTLKRLLDKGTLFSEVRAAGKRARLLNAFPPAYFTALKNGSQKVNVPVYAARAAGCDLLDLQAYRRGRAVSADLRGDYLASLDRSLPALEPEAAGLRLATLAQEVDFSFFDFWLSDSAGHRWSFARAVNLLEDLDRFLAGVVQGLKHTTLLVTSDHGNLEDKSVKTHTEHPVPLLVAGPGSEYFASTKSLLDIAPAVRRLLGLTGPEAVESTRESRSSRTRPL